MTAILLFLTIAFIVYSLANGGRIRKLLEHLAFLSHRVSILETHSIQVPDTAQAGTYEVYSKDGQLSFTFVIPDRWLVLNWKEFDALAAEIIAAIRGGYKPEFIQQSIQDEPNSLLALAQKLLWARDEKIISAANALVEKFFASYKEEVFEKFQNEEGSLFAAVTKLKALLATRSKV